MRERRNTILSASSRASSVGAAGDLLDSIDEKRHSSPSPSSLGLSLPLPVSSKDDRRRRGGHRRRSAMQVAVIVVGAFFCLRYLLVTDRAGALCRLGGSSSSAMSPPITWPSDPSVVTFPDAAAWTVAIPPNSSFPLPATTYEQICQDAIALGQQQTGKSAGDGSSPTRMWGLGWISPSSRYMDVYEAEVAGLLPPPPSLDQQPLTTASSASSSSSSSPASAAQQQSLPPTTVCERSLTFVLDEDDISLGESLLALWLSYGLARHERRAFLLDDSRWAWGRFAHYFQPLPTPNCTPPPAHHRTPWPAHARHRVLTRRTVPLVVAEQKLPSVFSSRHHHHVPFATAKEDAPLLALMLTGYRALFHLADADDAAYLAERVAHLRESQVAAQGAAGLSSPPPLVGVHIRRGDRHPAEFQYSNDYLPLERYIAAAAELLQQQQQQQEQQEQMVQRHHRSTAVARRSLTAAFGRLWGGGGGSEQMSSSSAIPSASEPLAITSNDNNTNNVLLLASDDPALPLHSDLLLAASTHALQISPAQDRIQLATKSALDAAVAPPALPPQDPATARWSHKHVEENAGWDGGFFTAMFAPRSRENADAGGGTADGDHASQATQYLARAYFLDLAVVIGATLSPPPPPQASLSERTIAAAGGGGVVCAASSATCRILGVAAAAAAVAEEEEVAEDHKQEADRWSSRSGHRGDHHPVLRSRFSFTSPRRHQRLLWVNVDHGAAKAGWSWDGR